MVNYDNSRHPPSRRGPARSRAPEPREHDRDRERPSERDRQTERGRRPDPATEREARESRGWKSTRPRTPAAPHPVERRPPARPARAERPPVRPEPHDLPDYFDDDPPRHERAAPPPARRRELESGQSTPGVRRALRPPPARMEREEPPPARREPRRDYDDEPLPRRREPASAARRAETHEPVHRDRHEPVSRRDRHEAEPRHERHEPAPRRERPEPPRRRELESGQSTLGVRRAAAPPRAPAPARERPAPAHRPAPAQERKPAPRPQPVRSNDESSWFTPASPLAPSLATAAPPPPRPAPSNVTILPSANQAEAHANLRAAWAPLMQVLGYEFRDITLLERALTHSSSKGQAGGRYHDNETMEFLGDSVLGLVIAEWLYEKLPEADEGVMSKLKSHLVSTKNMAEIAMSIRIPDFMILGGSGVNEARKNERLVCSTLEAVTGGVFLDGGYEPSKRMLRKVFYEQMRNLNPQETMEEDAKSTIQEYLQTKHHMLPHYESFLHKDAGDKIYITVIKARGQVLGEGMGKAKKDSQQDAARRSLERLRSGLVKIK